MRIALTGGAAGIGAALAQKLHDAGHELVVFDVNKPSGPVGQWIEIDLNDPVSITNALAQADGEFDALINNAGLPPRAGLAEKILRVNFCGFRRFLEGMEDKLSVNASIVNTASRAGAMWQQNIEQVKALIACDFDDIPPLIDRFEIDDTRAYNLSKEAVIVYGIAQTERLINKGLRLNSVSPAAISTGILDDFTKAFGAKVQKNIARVGRPGEPEEVADLIHFLISPQSNWIKGQDINIDGGMAACAITDMMELK
jgi:NAD(P)-dependent dehydrogenase (short-subunit alcohol dehydrogenase family)